ncbi:MAG: hypothetical protein ABI193_21985 [Minicystis sp.]
MSAGRVLTALLAARAAFGLTFLAVTLGKLPLPQYHPLDHRWSFEAQPSGFAMGWYGLTALGLLAALTGGGLIYLLGAVPRVARAFDRPAIVLAVAHAGGLILLVDFVYFGWVLSHQSPAPLPLPAWYCPR